MWRIGGGNRENHKDEDEEDDEEESQRKKKNIGNVARKLQSKKKYSYSPNFDEKLLKKIEVFYRSVFITNSYIYLYISSYSHIHTHSFSLWNVCICFISFLIIFFYLLLLFFFQMLNIRAPSALRSSTHATDGSPRRNIARIMYPFK